MIKHNRQTISKTLLKMSTTAQNQSQNNDLFGSDELRRLSTLIRQNRDVEAQRLLKIAPQDNDLPWELYDLLGLMEEAEIPRIRRRM